MGSCAPYLKYNRIVDHGKRGISVRKQGINLEKVKSANRFAITGLLYKQGPMSRKDIAAAVGLTPAGVTYICTELLEEGIIIECGEVEEAKRAGRKKILLDINPIHKYVLCAAIETDESYLSVTDLKGRVIRAAVIDTNKAIPAKDFLTAVADTFKTLMWESELAKGQVHSVAVSIPGYVSSIDARYVNVPKIWHEQVPLKEIMEQELGVPVVIDNNLRAYAKAELIFGEGLERDNRLIVKWGPGVGAAIISNNAIYEGANGMAAEIGQMYPANSSAQHKQGHLTTLEDQISTHGIIDSILERYGETEEEHERMPLFRQWLAEGNKISYKNTAEWGCIKDAALEEVIDSKIEALVYAVANTAIMMDPEKIIVIGYLFDVPGFYESFVDKMKKLLTEKEACFIKKSTLNLRQSHTEALAVVIDNDLRAE